MKSYIYIDDDLIGETKFEIVDESMGAVQGELIPSVLYHKYKKQIQALCEKDGVANISSFNLKILLEDKTILSPEGGIGILDILEFKEIYVETAGLDADTVKKICE